MKGQRVLPGVAYLEMARAAVEQAAGAWKKARPEFISRMWFGLRPIVVGDQPVQVHIGLYPEDNGEIAYEIYSDQEAVHSQGSAVLSSASEVPTLDIESLQAECAKAV